MSDVSPVRDRQPDDLEVASKSISQQNDERVVLQVIDAQYDGTSPQVLKTFRSGEEIAKGMEALPPHNSGTARILDITVHSDFIITGLRDTEGPEATRPAREFLIEFLRQRHARPFNKRRIFRWLNDPLLVNDIGSISSQWSQSLGGDSTNFYRLVNRTSLQQDPLDFDLHPRDSYLTCVQDDDDRLIVIIINDVWSKQTFRVNESRDDDISFHNPRIISGMLAGTGWTSLSDGSIDTFAKLLILDFFLASIYLQRVDYYGDLIYPQLSEMDALKFSLAKNPHLQVPLGLFEPRLSAKSREAFKEIQDAEGILRSVNNLVESIDFVIKALKPKDTTDSSTQQDRRDDYEERMRWLNGLCSERRSNAQRALEALNRQLDYLTKRHAIREAKAIKILTILASLYLPLSLSAALLSMQTPFRQVAHDRTADKTNEEERLVGTNLMFDFFGVFIWLATTTIFIMHAIRLGLWVRSNGLGMLSRLFSGPFSIFYYGKRWRFGGRGGRAFEILRGVTAWWVGLGFCITLLVIFFIGMLRTAQNAWDTAKWMFTTYIVVSGLLFGSYFGSYGYLYHRKVRGR